MLHAGVVEMLVKEHFQLAVGRIAAGAGIVPRQCQRAGKRIFTAMNTASAAVIHGRIWLRTFFISFSTSG